MRSKLILWLFKNYCSGLNLLPDQFNSLFHKEKTENIRYYRFRTSNKSSTMSSFDNDTPRISYIRDISQVSVDNFTK